MTKKNEIAPEFIPLAVVGLGGVFPKAKTLRQYWANIKNKVDAIQDVPASHWNKDDYFDADAKKQDKVYAYKGGFLETYDFDPSEFGLSPNTLEATDPAQLFALVAAKMALADAGYPVDKETWDRTRVSCILGVTGALEIVIPLGARLSLPAWRKAILAAGVPPAQAEDALARMSDEFVPWQEASFPGLLGNVIAGRVANRFNLGGTNCVVDAACGSSLSAMHMAALELQAGRAKMVVTGGVDTFNDIFMYTCFTKTPALSKSGHAKPFDASADGTTLGEGVGMIVLKRLDDAVKDGDKIHAILRGLGTSSDGRGKSIYAPSVGGQTRAIEALARLGRDDVHLALAGDGPLRAALEAQVNELGLTGQVHLLSHVADVRPLVLASRAMTLPSHREGLSRAVLEALALGVPVVGSDIRGIADSVRPDGGILVPPGDIAALTEAFRTVIDSLPPEPAAQGAIRVRMERYSLASIIAAHEALYDEVRKERRARRAA